MPGLNTHHMVMCNYSYCEPAVCGWDEWLVCLALTEVLPEWKHSGRATKCILTSSQLTWSNMDINVSVCACTHTHTHTHMHTYLDIHRCTQTQTHTHTHTTKHTVTHRNKVRWHHIWRIITSYQFDVWMQHWRWLQYVYQVCVCVCVCQCMCTHMACVHVHKHNRRVHAHTEHN